MFYIYSSLILFRNALFCDIKTAPMLNTFKYRFDKFVNKILISSSFCCWDRKSQKRKDHKKITEKPNKKNVEK